LRVPRTKNLYRKSVRVEKRTKSYEVFKVTSLKCQLSSTSVYLRSHYTK
jgi:hypothetical protein